MLLSCFFSFFFFNDTATTEIYTLSLHDALPISGRARCRGIWCLQYSCFVAATLARRGANPAWQQRSMNIDRKSTRLNSSHVRISYAVFCLKKKKTHAV